MRGARFRPDRHADTDRRADAVLRFNHQLTIDQLQTLLHAGESESTSFQGFNGIKASTGIEDGHEDFVVFTSQCDLKTPLAAMLDRVLERFLQNAEDTERNLLR